MAIKLYPSTDPQGIEFDRPPANLRVIRILGCGRAARAQLVDAKMPDGSVVRCVEKVFDPGLLTRTLYRLSFAAPFAYQSNVHAIRTSFYRRRVAATVIGASDINASVAMPMYTRFDTATRSWVLAAQWVDGRGIRPEKANSRRIRDWLRSHKAPDDRKAGSAEIDALLQVMRKLETTFNDCGLVGSGWQVAPGAMVSTANLLRVGNLYSVIDLESGIPAVLVPKYLFRGLKSGQLPPFDDLDADRLRRWVREHETNLTNRLGEDDFRTFVSDVNQLIEANEKWKSSEPALFRAPWRFLCRNGWNNYHAECRRRWQQNQFVDEAALNEVALGGMKARLLWWAGLVPSSAGRFLCRFIGRNQTRTATKAFFLDRRYRKRVLAEHHERQRSRWIAQERIPTKTLPSGIEYAKHRAYEVFMPARLHRFLVDGHRQRQCFLQCLLLLLSSRYQVWFGHRHVEKSIQRWESSSRLSTAEARELRDELCGHQVRAYVRGFGGHLAVKMLSPIMVPAKIGGIAAFIASGNAWFLMPWGVLPILRTIVTGSSWWNTRRVSVPHGEAAVIGLLPTVGTAAFPIQMYAARKTLSTFLVRDIASKFSQRMPIYGGPDSRTEVAFIRAADYLLEAMDVVSSQLTRFFPATESGSENETQVDQSYRFPRTHFGRWLDRQAIKLINSVEQTTSSKTVSERYSQDESSKAA